MEEFNVAGVFTPGKLVLMAVVFLSVLAGGLAFDSTGIVISEIFSISNMEESIPYVISLNFALFLVLFPITYALVVAMAKHLEKNEVRVIALLPAALAGLIALFTFGDMSAEFSQFALLGVVYLGTLLIVIETAFVKFSELKTMVLPRGIWSSAGAGFAILGVALFVMLAVPAFAEQDKYVEEFEQMIEEVVSGSAGEDVVSSTVDVFIASKLQAMQEVFTSEEYMALLQKDGEEVREFAAFAQEKVEEYQSDEYKEQMVGEAEGRVGANLGTVDMGALLEESIPMWGVMKQFLWIMQPLFIMIIFSFLSIIMKVFAMFFGTVFEWAIGTAFKEEEAPVQGAQ